MPSTAPGLSTEMLVPVRREDEPAWNQFAALHQKRYDSDPELTKLVSGLGEYKDQIQAGQLRGAVFRAGPPSCRDRPARAALASGVLRRRRESEVEIEALLVRDRKRKSDVVMGSLRAWKAPAQRPYREA